MTYDFFKTWVTWFDRWTDPLKVAVTPNLGRVIGLFLSDNGSSLRTSEMQMLSELWNRIKQVTFSLRKEKKERNLFILKQKRALREHGSYHVTPVL